ncbi:MAG: radical SAM protein [Deltaproteobacteria bacterium]|nr:radical SAM protein [Deltaproteobacteria bacterium]
MRVALIAPPYPLEEGLSAPLGICYAAAAFERANAEVIILDYMVRKYSPGKLIAELSEFKPDFIGATSVTLNFGVAASIVETAKKAFPSAITAMGGPHVSFDYDYTLKRYPGIDLIVVGEGEQTIAELVPAMHNRSAWQGINGLAFKENGKVVATPARELIKDLDSLPLPSRHLLQMSRYLAVGFALSIITSRGCPNGCIFCQGHRMVGHKIRSRNPKQVVDEIESLLAVGHERVNFSDDFFTSNRKRVKAICEEIQRRGLSFGWTAFSRADSVNREILKIMKDAGCDTIFYGMESGNQEILDRIKKRVTLDRIRKAVEDAKAVGMAVFGSFIVGLPGETKETMMDSHRFATELDIIHGYHFLAPFPGTEVKENIHEYDLELLTDDWAMFDANRPIVRTSGVNPEDLETFVDKYFLQPARQQEAQIEIRYQEGTLTPMEEMAYFGNKKLNIVYRILIEDLIETHGRIPFPKTNTATSMLLAEKLLPYIDTNFEFMLKSVEHLVEKGYLKHTIEDDHHVWRWA